MLRQLTVVQEKYLETIDELEQRDGAARVSDIAGLLSIKAPSVTQAVGRLIKLGLVTRTEQRRTRLSRKGRQMAILLRRRHDVLRRFMVGALGMDDEMADGEACRMEHAVSAEFVNRLAAFVESAQTF